MKKILLFGISILAIFAISCQKQPSATFKMSKEVVDVGETISFTNTSTDADYYGWDFGDGQSSILENPTHTFDAKGTYNISLYAYSENGRKKSLAAASVIVYPSTDLSLTVYINGQSTRVDDCIMKLFLNYTDWLNYTNTVDTGRTDKAGKIIFRGLEPRVYYIDAFKVDIPGYRYLSNWYIGNATNPLKPHVVNNYTMYVEYRLYKGGKKSYKVVKLESQINKHKTTLESSSNQAY